MRNFYKDDNVKKRCKEPHNPNFAKTNMKLNCRALVVGASGTGKTNWFMNYLENNPNTFAHVIVVNRGIPEVLYEVLEDALGPSGQISFFTKDTFPTVDQLNEKLKASPDKGDEYLFLFDDIVADLRDSKFAAKLKAYFTVGRKLKSTIIFLSQSYYDVPKLIRQNLNYLILLELSGERDIALILGDHATGLTTKQLKKMHAIAIENASDDTMNVLKIHVGSMSKNMSTKFARNFTDFFNLKTVTDENGDEFTEFSPGPWYKPSVYRKDLEPPKRKRSAECSPPDMRGHNGFDFIRQGRRPRYE